MEGLVSSFHVGDSFVAVRCDLIVTKVNLIPCTLHVPANCDVHQRVFQAFAEIYVIYDPYLVVVETNQTYSKTKQVDKTCFMEITCIKKN